MQTACSFRADTVSYQLFTVPNSMTFTPSQCWLLAIILLHRLMIFLFSLANTWKKNLSTQACLAPFWLLCKTFSATFSLNLDVMCEKISIFSCLYHTMTENLSRIIIVFFPITKIIVPILPSVISTLLLTFLKLAAASPTILSFHPCTLFPFCCSLVSILVL